MRKTARQRGLSHSALADQELAKEEKVFSFWKDDWDNLDGLLRCKNSDSNDEYW
jgi:hypothetical protein